MGLCLHKELGGDCLPFFYTFLLLPESRERGDLFHHQGYPAPPSVVPVL